MDATMDVLVREVGPRDGLQIIDQIVPTAQKIAWLDAEAAAGVSEIEACSFVPPKLIPQFADAADVVAHALTISGLTVAALIPNLKGAERGIANHVHKLNFVMSVSESHNRSNVRRTREQSVADFARIAELVKSTEPNRRPRLAAGLSTALGCTIEGSIDGAEVIRYAARLGETGADEIVVADTVGYADPASVRRVFMGVIGAVKPLPVWAHFHDTRGLGLANVLAALDVGVRRFDSSLAGLGGCPYAPGATGNIVTEDLVFMLESMGLRTGIDLKELIEVRAIIRSVLPDVPLYGSIAKAGLPKGFKPASRPRERVRA